MTERNILIIDDSITILQGIKLVLKQAELFDHYFEARSAAEGMKILNENPVDVILCDIIMPGMDGFEFLSEVKAREKYMDIPVILLTGQEALDKKIKGLDMGASDYVTKPFDPDELIARVQVQTKVKRLQDELKLAKQRYKELSITDYLTQIHNRRHFMELFDREFSRATRYLYDLSLVIFDLDNFKMVNDTYGHLQGDRVLKGVADGVKSEIRSHDVFARYGGEEFILLLPQTPLKGASLVAEKIRRNIAETSIDGMAIGDVTISIGVASYPNSRVKDSHSLISLADEAMYNAKTNGKNRVEVAESLPESADDSSANVQKD